MKLKDIDLCAIGNTIQMAGAVYSGDGKAFLCLFPDERHDLPLEVLEMDSEDWKVFLRQTDLMETQVMAKAADGTLTKAMIRKSTRVVDTTISWNVFRRDNYTCRYCGNNKIPLTVDHLVLWEEGGPSTEANMVSACKKCNKTRGNKQFSEWLQDTHYRRVSVNLLPEVRAANEALLATLASIPRKLHVASR
jgi:hypothetical protein